MAKNNKLINSLRLVAERNRMENIRKAAEQDTPAIYAALALALWNTLDIPEEERTDAIKTVFAESQAIWYECVNTNKDMVSMCLERTGIDVQGTVEE